MKLTTSFERDRSRVHRIFVNFIVENRIHQIQLIFALSLIEISPVPWIWVIGLFLLFQALTWASPTQVLLISLIFPTEIWFPLEGISPNYSDLLSPLILLLQIRKTGIRFKLSGIRLVGLWFAIFLVILLAAQLLQSQVSEAGFLEIGALWGSRFLLFMNGLFFGLELTRAEFRKAIGFVSFSIACLIGIGICIAVWGDLVGINRELAVGEFGRLQFPYNNSNMLAAFLAVMFIVRTVTEPQSKSPTFDPIGLVLFIGLYLTGSRAGLIAVLLFAICYPILKAKRHRLKSYLFLSLGIIAPTVALDVIFRWISASGSAKTSSERGALGLSARDDLFQPEPRYEKWIDALALIDQSLIWGYGLRNLQELEYNPHNTLLQIAIIAGAALLVWIIFGFFLLAHRTLRRKRIRFWLKVIPVALGSSPLILTGDLFWFHLFWWLTGLLAGLPVIGHSTQRSLPETQGTYRE